MSYEFKRKRPLGKEAKRILENQLAEARASLMDESCSLAKRVHRARRSLKKARASLRLVRGRLRRKIFRRVDRRCRNPGRVLSEMRDAQVFGQTARSVFDRFEPQLGGRRIRVLERDVRRIRKRIMEKAVTPAHLRSARSQIKHARAAAARLELPGRGWQMFSARPCVRQTSPRQ